MARIFSLLFVFVLAGAACAQQEPLVKKVKTSIAKGVDYLVKQQHPDGGWETIQDVENKNIYEGGPTALAVLALLNCDGVIDDPVREAERKKAIQRGLENLRKLKPPSRVYVRALQTMAFAEAKTDRNVIQANVEWLLQARVYRDGSKTFIGWYYDNKESNRLSDASNSQYAMLALWYARQAGVPVERKVWEEIRTYCARTQRDDGSWIYSPDYFKAGEKDRPSMTMTVAGLCGLSIASMELNSGREKWLANGRFQNCGSYDNDDALAKAQTWLSKNFTIDLKERAYYHLYGLERAGRLSGNRFFGEHDWYREGCEYLVKKQEPNGAWSARGGWDRWPHINTSFALLFLSKGRTPVLMSKLVHGNWPRVEWDADWNNDRNDLRHLTDYVSRTDLFEKKAIAWQTYDIRRAIEAMQKGASLSAEEEAAIVADMRQSPIVYITGHRFPAGRFQAVEIKLIKRYVESGGFIFAEACCGSPDFDKGFKEWVNDNWDQPLEYIASTHPVWTCFNEIKPGKPNPYQLMALQTGCRTVMLYSPQDLSCHWESNQHDGAARPAFLLGANIVAFATGKIPPQPRLTPIEIADNEREIKDPRQRGAFRVRQLRHGPDMPAQNAMKNLLEHVRKVTGLEVVSRVDPPLPLKGFGAATRTAKFFYMHGRGDFSTNPKDLGDLRFTLQYGGLLFADACCGDKDFDNAFRKFAQDLFPKEKLVKVPADATGRDYLFSAALNEKELSAKNIQCRVKANGPMAPMEPHLEGIKINGRWVVLYSPYDIGCALERSTSPNCAGYDPDSAFKIATAAVLYNTRP